MYIGIGRGINESRIKILVPHELNHCPVALFWEDKNLTANMVSEVMELSINKPKKLIDNRDMPEKGVTAEFGTTLTAKK